MALYLGRSSPVSVRTGTVLESFHRQVGPARRAYRRFLLDGLSHGHQERFYETVDQHILGDQRFLHTVARLAKISAPSARPRRVAFGPLLRAIASVHQVAPKAILAPGRQRTPVPARAMFVFLAREWGRLTTQELGRRLQRDPSMISRLASTYAARREPAIEAQISRLVASPSAS